METVKLLRRKDVPKEQTWDLSLIYPAVEDMEKDLEKAGKLADEIAACRGKLTEPASIRACLEKYQEMEALFSHILAYVQLAVSADYYDEQLKQRENRAVSLHAQMESQVSFMKDELTSLPEEVLKETAEQAPEFSVYLQDLLREKTPAWRGNGKNAGSSVSGSGSPFAALFHHKNGRHPVSVIHGGWEGISAQLFFV